MEMAKQQRTESQDEANAQKEIEPQDEANARKETEPQDDANARKETELQDEANANELEALSSPKLGMKFSTIEEAWKFWVDYGGKIGFGVRKHYFNRSKKDGNITSYKFVCCKEGNRKTDKRDIMTVNPRLETRTDCKVRMGISLKNGKYTVYDFIGEHNHPMHLPETVHMLASQRKLSEVQAYEIDLAQDSGLQQRASFDFMSRQAGGRSNLGFTRLDAKNYIRSKRQRSMAYGEVGCLLQYFQSQLLENPSFFHAYQIDAEEQITNVFWADARMVMDYIYFGDVISLDTTYSTNKANRPLALFCGFNHFRGAVIFGAALMYDETAESFKWLFETFLEAHRKKMPLTIFTDQDQAMAKALREVMPEVSHGLCTWHLMQNGIKHLGNLMKDGSHFLTDFKKCMYGFEEELQFEMAWNNLLSKYNVHENAWLGSLYKIKEKWAACHMKKAFTAGMRSTQLSESLNSDFKSCMKPDLDIVQFFKQFDRVVGDKRYNELKCEFKSRHRVPRLKIENSLMLQQLAQIYTFTIFDLFQKEFDLYAAACIKYRNESQSTFEYIVGMVNQEGEYRVSFDPVNKFITCGCRKFETFGILCCHALKIFDVMDVKILPDQYIVKRWTKEARSGMIHDIIENAIEEDPKLGSTLRYRQLCPKLIRLATEVADLPELYFMVDKAVDELTREVMQLRLKHRGQDNSSGATTLPTNECGVKVKGLKRKIGIKSKKRLKSWVEVQSKKRRRVIRNHDSQDRESQFENQPKISSTAQASSVYNQSYSESNFSYSQMLKASLDQPMQSLDTLEFFGAISDAHKIVD